MIKFSGNMKKDFSVAYLLFSFVIAIITAISVFTFIPQGLKTGVVSNAAFFFFVTYLFGILLIVFLEKARQQATGLILSLVFLKMIVAVVYFLLVFKRYDEMLIYFTFSFFISYLIFTTFEVAFIVRKLNKKQ